MTHLEWREVARRAARSGGLTCPQLTLRQRGDDRRPVGDGRQQRQVHGDLHLVGLRGGAGHAVFRQHDVVAERDRFGRRAGQGDVGGDSAEHDRVDAVAAQRGVQGGAGERRHAVRAVAHHVGRLDHQVVVDGAAGGADDEQASPLDAGREGAVDQEAVPVGGAGGDHGEDHRRAGRAERRRQGVDPGDDAACGDLPGERRVDVGRVGDAVLHLVDDQRRPLPWFEPAYRCHDPPVPFPPAVTGPWSRGAACAHGQSRSMIVALAIPPPSHMVCRP